MIRYILHRIVISLLTIFLIASACFFLLRALPGNPFLSETIRSQEMVDKMMHYYGLDKPLVRQYLIYMGNLIQGDFGYSIKYSGRSVNYVIATTFPVSARLGLQALLFGIPMGLLFGIISAQRRGRTVDHAFSMSTIIVTSLPGFLIAAFLQYLFAIKLKWLPVAQWKGFMYTILPTIAMAAPGIAGRTRAMRTLMLEVGQQDYLRTAKAKGMSEARMVFFHQVRNAIIPMVANLGLEVSGMLMGSFIIEKIFSIPGMGAYFVNSISGLDYTMVMGLTVFSGSFIVFANFIVDLLYGIIDPRIRVT